MALVPVKTMAGVLMMTPEMAAQVAPYVDPVLGDPDLVVKGALPPEHEAIKAASMPAGATTTTPEQDRAQLASAMATEDPSTLAPVPASAPMASVGQQAPMQTQGPSPLQQLLASPPSTTATSSTRRTGIPVTGPRRQEIDAANQSALDAQRKSAAATGALADAQTAVARKDAEQAEQLARADEARRVRQDAIINEARQKRDAAWEKVPDKLDPDRWDKTGGVARVLGAISVMIGGISQGITGRENPGKAIIDGVVQADLEQQRAEMQLAEQEATRADNELQDALDMYGDPILAEKQLQLDAYGAVLKEMQATMQAAQGEQLKAAAAQGIAEMQGEIARLQNEMDGRVGEMVTQSQTDPGLDFNIWRTQVQTLADQEAAQGDPYHGMNDASKRDAVSRIVRLPDGQQVWATSTAQADKTNALIGAHGRYTRRIAELRDIAKNNIGKTLSPELRGRIKAIVQANKIALKDTNELGAITAADQELVTPLSGESLLNLTSFDSGSLAALDEAESYVNEQLDHRMQNLYTHPMAATGSQLRQGTAAAHGEIDPGID